MRLTILVLLMSFSTVFFNACSGGMGSSKTSSTPIGNQQLFGIVQSGPNVVAVRMSCGYINEPCVSVTICEPGSTTNCQTINNVLLDTGSYGLRLFKSVVSLNLTQETNAGGKPVAECVGYADGSSQWGPVAKADITLGTETASNVPIQLVDSTYAALPSGCTDPDTSPADNGFNGILGVGLFVQDCGSSCVTSANNHLYYACTGTSCVGSVVTLANQVTNPVSMLPSDNNGVLLSLPSIPQAGASNVVGSLILGIGTRSNNTPGGTVKTFVADTAGDFKTTYGGTQYPAFIDSGSNGLFFPSTTITACGPEESGFFCPATTVNSSGTQAGATGVVSQSVSFTIDSADTLASTGNSVFYNLGGKMTGYFDWGLPFFLGRDVYVGIAGKTSGLGTGPYWGY